MTKKAEPENAKPSEMESKFQLLLTLITLLKNTRHKQKKTELEFLMVNQTFNLVPYRHCVYWEYKANKVIIKNMSGLVQIDADGPYTQWLARVISHILDSEHKAAKDEDNNSFSKLLAVKPENCGEPEKAEWNSWCPQNALLMIMKDDNHKTIGGLWMDREKAFGNLETAILEDLGDGYAHKIQNFAAKKKQGSLLNPLSFFSLSGLGVRLFFLALFVILFIPVRTSATAPAEIVANKPDTINVPFDGVIDTVEVLPGQQVQKGDVLIRMDSTVLKNKVTMATGEAEAASIALRKTERESLTDRAKLAEIAILKAQVAQKGAEAEFAREMLQRAEIIADRDGVVIFPDPHALQGKPVQTGEQVMLLADPNDSELLIRMPIDSMIIIDEDVPARFFLNVMPLDYEQAEYESIGYQATPDAGGLMTYKIRAKFTEKPENIRIGWTGTGKVYGEWTILAFNILRRPIVALRSKLGV